VRVKWQKYLGTPDAIKERLDAASTENEPVRLITESYGAVFIANVLEDRLGTIGIIDGIVRRHKKEVGPTVGEYFLYAWANRLVAPKSKRALEDWYRKTAIQMLRPIDLAQLMSQRYWEKWDRVSVEAVEKIGEAFLKKVWAEQHVPPECVLFDTTNYFTYMASHTESELAQRGHNKAGKHQLRQIGVGLLVDRNTQLPLYYRAYEGNTHDSKLFRNIVDEMFGTLCGYNQTKQRLTVVFDKGMNSDENIEFIDDSTRIHFITTYSPYFAEDLAATDIALFSPLSIISNVKKDDEGRSSDKVTAFRTKCELWGKIGRSS
jgi:transposase